jgi:hypothetical protein
MDVMETKSKDILLLLSKNYLLLQNWAKNLKDSKFNAASSLL